MEWVTVAVSSGMGIIGTVVGALLAYRLARKSQQEQWARENRRSEFRELMAALSQAYTAFGEFSPQMFVADDLFRRMHASGQFLIAVRDRIFVAEDVKRMKIGALWIDATESFMKTLDIDKFNRAYTEINRLIIEEAMRPD